MLQRLFRLKEHNTDVKTEVVAGVTTFMTLSYNNSKFEIEFLISNFESLIFVNGNLAEHEKHVGGHCLPILPGWSEAAG
jgi:hypothetical protein